TYDEFGRQTSSRVTDATGAVVYQQDGLTHYDAVGKVDWQTDAANQKTWTVYDGDGRVTQEIAPDGTSTQTHYDAAGNKDYTIDALNRRTDYEYTPEGWLQ